MRALILDDERPAITLLEHYLRENPDITEIVGFSNPYDAGQFLEKGTVDICFLDIQLPDSSGLEFALSVAERPDPPEIIFVTAFKEYAYDAFESNGIDFLLKPVKQDRLNGAIARVKTFLRGRQQLSQTQGCITMRRDDPPQFYFDGTEIDFRTKKSAKLLGMLAESYPYSVTQVSLIDALWLDLDADAAMNNLRVTISTLNRHLSPYHIDVEYKTGKYRLTDKIEIV